MTTEERTALLYKEAMLRGIEDPTESMIGDAIHDACEEALNDMVYALEEHFPDAAKAVERWRARKMLDADGEDVA